MKGGEAGDRGRDEALKSLEYISGKIWIFPDSSGMGTLIRAWSNCAIGNEKPPRLVHTLLTKVCARQDSVSGFQMKTTEILFIFDTAYFPSIRFNIKICPELAAAGEAPKLSVKKQPMWISREKWSNCSYWLLPNGNCSTFTTLILLPGFLWTEVRMST